MKEKILTLVIILIMIYFIYYPLLKSVIKYYKLDMMHIKTYVKTIGKVHYFLWGMRKKFFSFYTLFNALVMIYTVVIYLIFIVIQKNHIILNFSLIGFLLFTGIQILLSFLLGEHFHSKKFEKPKFKEVLEKIKAYRKEHILD